MELSLYTAVYLFTNAFDTYLTYSFMKIFFKNNDMNKKAALFSMHLSGKGAVFL